VFENRLLRAIFGSKRDKVTGEWRELRNEEHYGLFCSPNIIQMTKSSEMRWAGHVARVRDGRGTYRDLVSKPGGTRPLARPKS
jgi:hypothetical protein